MCLVQHHHHVFVVMVRADTTQPILEDKWSLPRDSICKTLFFFTAKVSDTLLEHSKGGILRAVLVPSLDTFGNRVANTVPTSCVKSHCLV